MQTAPPKDLFVNNFVCPNIATGRLNAKEILLNGKRLRVRRGPPGPAGPPGSVLSYGTATDVGFVAPSETKGGSFALENDIGLNSYANTAFGRSALQEMTDDPSNLQNTAFGYFSASGLTLGSQNTALGSQALNDSKGAQSCVAIGNGAMSFMADPTELLVNCIGIGSNCLTGVGNAGGCVVIGTNAASSGLQTNDLIAIGDNACLNLTTSYGNVAVGADALLSLVDDVNGSNTAIGNGSLIFATGAHNTALGCTAGRGLNAGVNNVFIGSVSGQSVGNSNNNILIGKGTDVLGPMDGNILIGTEVTTVLSNHMELGTGSIATTTIKGIFGVTVAGGTAVYIDGTGKMGSIVSSERYKENIEDIDDKVIEKVMSFSPKQFNLKDQPEEVSFGFIAEQVNSIAPEFVVFGKNQEVESVKYHLLFAPFLKILQTQEQEIKFLKSELQALKALLPLASL